MTGMSIATHTCACTKPCAPAHHWHAIARLFRAGNDTLQIARFLNLSEAEVYNALPLALEQKQ